VLLETAQSQLDAEHRRRQQGFVHASDCAEIETYALVDTVVGSDRSGDREGDGEGDGDMAIAFTSLGDALDSSRQLHHSFAAWESTRRALAADLSDRRLAAVAVMAVCDRALQLGQSMERNVVAVAAEWLQALVDERSAVRSVRVTDLARDGAWLAADLCRSLEQRAARLERGSVYRRQTMDRLCRKHRSAMNGDCVELAQEIQTKYAEQRRQQASDDQERDDLRRQCAALRTPDQERQWQALGVIGHDGNGGTMDHPSTAATGPTAVRPLPPDLAAPLDSAAPLGQDTMARESSVAASPGPSLGSRSHGASGSSGRQHFPAAAADERTDGDQPAQPRRAPDGHGIGTRAALPDPFGEGESFCVFVGLEAFKIVRFVAGAGSAPDSDDIASPPSPSPSEGFHRCFVARTRHMLFADFIVVNADGGVRL